MPVTYTFDVRITITVPTPTGKLSQRDRDILFGQIPLVAAKPLVSEEDINPEIQLEIVDPNDQPITEEELISGYDEIRNKMDEFLSLLRIRSRNLVLQIDRDLNPELFQAVNDLFESPEPITEISYEMYLTALEYSANLGLEIGRNL